MAALVDSPAPASPSLADDSSTASSSTSKDRRPSLSISTAHAQPAPPPTNDASASPPPPAHPRSSPSTERPASGGGSSAGAGGGIRSFSHTRSQSMSEQHHHNSPTSPPSAGGEGSSAGGAQGGSAGDLVRRHHTLSTSSSRMGRLERSRARLALQGVGLSEEDQDFYIPPSPVRSGPVGGWSDVGHGASSYGAPPTRHSLAVVGESHSRSTSNSSAWGGSSEAASSPSVGAGAGVSPQGEQQEQDQQQPMQALPPPAAKRSSFVVLRGAKGDAALTQRRTEQPQQQQPAVGSPPRVDSLAQRTSSPPNKELKHKNSLKPFLEAEASSAGGEEEWERSLKDERDKEEMELRRGEEEQFSREPYSTPPLGSSHSSQGHSPFAHSRATTYQQTGSSVDPWNAGDDSQTASVRRHQSLNSFHPTTTTSSESLSAASHDGGWGAHTRLASSEELLGSLSLGSVGFGRSRSGTSPAPLTLGNSHTTLSHSNSLNSHLPGHNHTSLHHSNSLGSHDRGALSPVGFPRSPWSPTYAETKQLGGISSVVGGTPPTGMGLSRGGSGSSRGSRISEEVSRMSEEMAQMELGVDGRPLGGKSPSPPGLDRENSVSPQPPLQGVGRSLSGNAPPTTNRRLPPLMTNLDTIQQQHSQHPQQQQAQQPLNNSFLSRQGPASASAYVPPIGHSHLPSSTSQLPASSQAQANYLPSIAEPNQHTARGNFTAVPGASSSDWHRQKEMLIGAGASSAFPSAVGVNPTGEAWPAGGGFGVGIAIQQQQQIQVLQNQMQQALSAMEVMRNQGAQIPAGFTAPGLRGAPNGFGAAGAFGAGTGLSPPPPIAGTQVNGANAVDSPIDIPTLVANKGYNPTVFDLRPANARFFVIKSYTEEDVHKSLKYEIWASTDLGNKRLDRAFRESADKGPIYLFFSVNASGHFAGMAQMLTPVDYQTSSNVWASDKWKGVLKVRWIYIKDVPLASLRHIRLSNTPENKPVTSSRDTQEVPYDAGLEVLRILSSYQSRTSLLQDLPWYEAKLSQGGADKEDGEETPHPSHYARPTPSPQPGHQPHYAPRPPQSHSPAPFQPPPHHQQQQQQQQQTYLAAQAQYGMPIPTGPMGMGVGAPQFAPMPQQQQQMQNAGGGGGGRRFFNRNGGGGGGGGGPQVF